MIYILNDRKYEARGFYHLWRKTGVNTLSDDIYEKITFGFVIDINGIAETTKEMSVVWQKPSILKNVSGVSKVEIYPGHLDLLDYNYIRILLAKYYHLNMKGRLSPNELEELLSDNGFNEDTSYGQY